MIMLYLAGLLLLFLLNSFLAVRMHRKCVACAEDLNYKEILKSPKVYLYYAPTYAYTFALAALSIPLVGGISSSLELLILFLIPVLAHVILTKYYLPIYFSASCKNADRISLEIFKYALICKLSYMYAGSFEGDDFYIAAVFSLIGTTLVVYLERLTIVRYLSENK